MESEKVKEIKYYLEQSACMYGNMQKQALTLINELESENEKLKQHKRELQGGQHDLCLLNKEQTLRIAELEKVYDRQVRIINDLNIEVVKEQEKLKHFAERLKERLYNHRIWEEPYEEWCKGNVVCGKIDETLKECIK